MRFIADFHIHSKYSRATSKGMDLEHLDRWAKIKGIGVLGTGDFTHPQWLQSLKEKLEPAEPGLFKVKKNLSLAPSPTPLPPSLLGRGEMVGEGVRFILTTEISCIYSKAGSVRKIHIIIFAPCFDIVEKINTQLGWIGNLKADGRPILGLDAKELAKIVLNISENCLIVPAHLWTPWFSLFGSRSGFDSLEECFEEYSKYIYAGETGLSADPAMCWRLSALDKITLISNSDSHSARKIGREANVFEGEELNYHAIINAIKQGNKANLQPLKLIYTIEFFPQEGKYHYDGHRACHLCLSPQDARKYNNVCPNCGRPLTLGVCHRVEELADREEGEQPPGAIPFRNLIPLEEIIAGALGKGVGTKQVDAEYKNLIKKFGTEFAVLLEVLQSDLEGATTPEVALGIARVREGKVSIEPGYDGLYGKIKIFSRAEKKNYSQQKTLF